MELGVLFAEFLAIEEEQHRAPIGLTDETGDDAHDGGMTLKKTPMDFSMDLRY